VISAYHAKYYAYELTRRHDADGVDRLSQSLFDASVDLNPHQIDAALFALRNPVQQGVLLADEVGLGKTIEAALVLCQYWAERRRRLLVVCPASLRKQWAQELLEKFALRATVLDAVSLRKLRAGTALSTLEGLAGRQVVILSYQFAAKLEAEMRAIPWDLVVIDEAHKLRNAHRANNRTGQALRRAFDGRKKLLLTATPLQNSLMELYGLSTLLDEHLFGDEAAFRKRFMSAGAALSGLRDRLQTFAKRTLRKQVLEYVRYTERKALTQPFNPTDDEQSLYEAISAFLAKEDSYALPRQQRHLTALILRKLLASSSHAVVATLATIRERLEKLLEDQTATDDGLLEKLIEDEDIEDDYLEESGDALDEAADREPGKIDPAAVRREITEITGFIDSAGRIQTDTKAQALKTIEAAIRQLYENHRIEYRSEVEAQGLEWDLEKSNDPWKGLYNYNNAEYRDEIGQLVSESDAESKNAKIWIWRESDASMPATKQASSTYDPNDKNWRFYKPLHPITGLPCPHPKSGWKFAYDNDENSPEKRSFVALDCDHRIVWGGDEKKVPQLKRMLHEVETNVGKSVFTDYSDGEKQTSAMFGRSGVFLAPKHSNFVQRFVQHAAKIDSIVLDCFGGTGSTAHAVIELNRDDNGSRNYLTVEIGGYFDSVLKPRTLKAVYSKDWRLGKPIGRKGVSQCIKVLRLESYEDALNNLVLNGLGKDVLDAGDANLQRDYLLRYMLDVETQGSQSLLNVAEFRDPTAYQLEIKQPGSDERVKRNVDLVETFNWLIGLHVDKLHAGRRFSATFARKPDPLLPDDAHTRLQAEILSEAADGAWWFRPVEGYVRTVPGDDRHRQTVLVLWRSLTDDPEQDAAVLEAFLAQQLRFNPTRREDKTLYDLIYINGTHNLPNLGKYGEVRLLEEEFHRRMWSQEDV
jgi:superfamily II DNA or RNA helicase